MLPPAMRSPPPAYRLRLADVPQCVAADGSVHELGGPDALLLAWLAVQGPTARERLAQLMWPDSSAEVARNALRQRLFRLRRQFGNALVEGTQQLSLRAQVTHDLGGSDTLLGGLEAPVGEMRLWLQAERDRRREVQRRQWVSRIEAHEAEGDGAAALPLAMRLIEMDPLSEDAHRHLIRLHYLAGDRSAALRAFDRCEQLLKHEVGTRPGPQTLALLDAIERSAPPSSGSTAVQRRSLPAALMRPPRLIGRQAELQRLLGAWHAAGRLIVTGEAGLGKSRLLQALAGAAESPLFTAARPGDALSPYATLARALRGALARLPTGISANLQAALAPVLPELDDTHPSPVANSTQGCSTRPAAPATAGNAGNGSPTRITPRDTLLQAVLALLGQGPQSGVVLDDLHFADEASLQLLPDLLVAHGGAWVLSLRPPQPGSPQLEMLQAVQADGRCERMALAPLNQADLAELVDSIALPQVAGVALAPLLLERSGGNPLFALETLKQAWLCGGLEGAAILPRPRSVTQLIQQSLAALSAPALLLARVAAIAGTDFSIELASHVLQQSTLQLSDAWSELESRQLLRGTDFAHDLVHESVLETIPDVLARHTHATVAQWLQARQGEPARLAAHWEAAGQSERALPALRVAAERAHAALRVAERIGFLLRAADIAEAQGMGDDAFALVAQAIEAHMNTVRHAAGLPLLDRLDRLAVTPRQQVEALGLRAWYATNLGRWPDAIDLGSRALALCQALPPDDAEATAAMRASLTQRLGTVLALSGRFDEALPLLLSVQSWVNAHAGTDTAAEFNGNLAAVLDNLGRPAQAQPHHQRAIAATRELGDHAFLATALANHAVNRLNAGDVDGAQRQLTAAHQLVCSYELHGASAGFVASLLAQTARARGDYSAALEWCEQAEGMLLGASPGWLPVVGMHRAQILLDLGQWARAGQLLQQLDATALSPRLSARHGGLRGRWRRSLGDEPGAQVAFAQALQAAPTNGWPELHLSLRIDQAAAWPAEAARAELQAVADCAAASGLPGLVLAARLRLAALTPTTRRGLALAREFAPRPTTGVARPLTGIDQVAQPDLRHMSPCAEGEVLPNGLCRIECWLGPALGLAEGGDSAGARALAQSGMHWVERVAADQVPAEFRDAFLHRQPQVVQLRRLLALPEVRAAKARVNGGVTGTALKTD